MLKFTYFFYIFSIVILLNIHAASNAQSKGNWYNKFYLRADMGAFAPVNSFKDAGELDPYSPGKLRKTTIYNIGIGYKITDNIRSDLNFSCRKLKYYAEDIDEYGDLDKTFNQKIENYSFFLNGYYDFNISKIIRPYLTAGIGYGKSHNRGLLFNPNVEDSDDSNVLYPGVNRGSFIWNLGVGTRVILSDRFNLSVSYRYAYLGRITTKTADYEPDMQPSRQTIKSHEVMGGIIVNF